jgi:fucose 4-O-acetylase-like acetyltransferase
MRREIDILKGLGIIAVVAAHVFTSLPSILIYVFHMPLFFFISGFLFKQAREPVVYCRKKVIHLLVPYFCYLLPLSLPVLIKPLMHLVKTPSVGWFMQAVEDLGEDIYGGPYLRGATGVLWLVTFLFITQQGYNLLRAKLSNRQLGWTVAGFYALAIGNQFACKDFSLPWSANVALCATLFFFIGDRFGKRLTTDYWSASFSVLLLPVAVALVLRGWPVSPDMKFVNYGMPVLSPLLATAAIIALFWVARAADRWEPLAVSLAAIGGASLTIMFLHQFVHLYICPHVRITNPFTIVAVAVGSSYAVHLVVTRFRLTRALLLGSETDFNALVQTRSRLVVAGEPVSEAGAIAG